jgi:hypothetical protein
MLEFRRTMSFFRHRSFQILCAFFSFLVITSDLVADGIHEASGGCATESQTGSHESCPNCACPLHNGSAVMLDAIVFVAPAADATGLVSSPDDPSAIGTPPAIDHPPQLA